LSTDPTSLALLVLLDQTVSRLDRDGQILGAWVGASPYLSDVPSAQLEQFEEAIGLNVADMLDEDSEPIVLGAIAECLQTAQPVVVEYETHFTGRLLHLVGRCAPCGEDEVLWVTRDLTPQHLARQAELARADLEATIGDCLHSLIDVGPDRLDQALDRAMHDIARHFGAESAFVRRFRGRSRVEVVCQWRAPALRGAPPGTTNAGAGAFPWATRRLVEQQVLVVSDPSSLPEEAATDRSSLGELGNRGFVWVRVGLPRRPIALLGLIWDGRPPSDDPDVYAPLARLAETVVAVVDRHTADARLEVQHRVFELVARGSPLGEVLAEVCRLREMERPGLCCVAWMADGTGSLRVVGSTTLSPSLLARLERIRPDGPELDTFEDGVARWLDRGNDPAGSIGSVADLLGANAVEVTPLLSSRPEGTTGVLALYDTSADPLKPGSTDRESAGLAASLAMIAVERIADLNELSHQATHDPLTGLANRLTFLDRLEQALVRSADSDRLVAVLYCDIDHFKEVNDRLGHATGDHLLRVVAERIRTQVGHIDSVARFGGDEFAVLLDDLEDEEDALEIAEHIRNAVRVEGAVPGVTVTVSVGTAVSGAGNDHADGLLRDADMAMYRAKSGGRNRIEVFRERIRREAQHRDRLARDLAEAIDAHEIDVHFQPMLELEGGRLTGFEALARWTHPEHGAISPDVFVPIAESNGLIGRLGDLVTERSLAVAAGWDGLDLHVNLSAPQVDEIGYVDRLRSMLRASGLVPERLALEITESVLLSESSATIENLRSLLSIGIGLVLDDFGTGYASLTYLRRFPFRGIKVDRTFVAGIEERAEDAVIVGMVLDLAASLGLGVVAEGVETAGQEAELRRLHCPQVQGFRYSPAVPEAEVPSLIERFSTSASPTS
jgi:diguanylate cyclase (GGDEF)-like protein